MPLAGQLAMGRVFALKDVRVFFKKTGRMKFISHLDLQRFMIRMIRRSGIPVWYSEGFNPHPYITFALPLSLGFESTYDVMDMRLDDDNFPLDKTLEMLKAVMPDGIELFGIGEPKTKAGKIAFADYEIIFDKIGDDVVESFNAFLSQKEILTEKRSKKGKMNKVDLAPSIKSFKVSNGKIDITLVAGANNLNPKLIFEAFEESSGIKLPYLKVVRTMIYDIDGNEFM